MLIHPEHSRCVLVERSDLAGEPDHPLLRGITDRLRQVFRWAWEYLCQPHPELGRKGAVCPFAQGSLDRGTFFLAVHRGSTVSPDELEDVLLVYRDWFRVLEPRTGPAAQFKTILLTLPDLPATAAASVVDATQERLKPRYVAEGLMIGEFHAGPPPKGGLWNPDFRPLRSPLPLLAIRHMIASDFPFLVDQPDFVAIYLRLFGASTPPVLRPRVLEAARRFGLTIGTEEGS